MGHRVKDYRHYWEERLLKHPNLRGTGHRAFSLTYNHILYQAQLDCLELILARYHISLQGKRVLDIGSGTGFYIQFFRQAGAAQVVGVDIASTSVDLLRQQFPDSEFYNVDIGSSELPIAGPFDLIAAISVLYHIIDDAHFEQALENIGGLLVDGGFLIISDTFCLPLVPIMASHVRFRPLSLYRSLLSQHNVQIVDTIPIYYLLNRTFVPLVGPLFLRLGWLHRWLYEVDRQWRAEGRDNGRGMKLMLARKAMN
ncbi:MAG: class I SAM-dependent methyltransferase [Candidatus Methanomethyliaceae archaeon]